MTPSDADDLPMATKALYIGTGGDLTLRSVESPADVTFRNLPDAAIIDVRVRAVRATGTTAGDIVALAWWDASVSARAGIERVQVWRPRRLLTLLWRSHHRLDGMAPRRRASWQPPSTLRARPPSRRCA